MTKPVEAQLTVSCLQCDWSVETVNTPPEVSRAFLEAAHSHASEHEQHALEVVQRLRIYSENYVEPAPPAYSHDCANCQSLSDGDRHPIRPIFTCQSAHGLLNSPRTDRERSLPPSTSFSERL